MSRLIVFGATGGTGQAVVDYALSRGDHVTAVARNPGGLPSHPRLTVIEGNVLEPESFVRHLAGHDAVLSCLGVGTNLGPTTVYSQGTAHILSGMLACGMKRLIAISAGGLEVHPQMGFPIGFVTKFILQNVLKNLYSDMSQMENVLQESQLDWTVLRPSMLVGGAFTGKFRVAVGEHLARPFRLSRTHLAHYMVDSVTTASTYQKVVEISH